MLLLFIMSSVTFKSLLANTPKTYHKCILAPRENELTEDLLKLLSSKRFKVQNNEEHNKNQDKYFQNIPIS